MSVLVDLAKVLGVDPGFLGSVLARLGVSIGRAGEVDMQKAMRALAGNLEVLRGKVGEQLSLLPVTAEGTGFQTPAPELVVPMRPVAPAQLRTAVGERIRRGVSATCAVQILEQYGIEAQLVAHRGQPWQIRMGKAVAAFSASSVSRRSRIVKIGIGGPLIKKMDFALAWFERSGRAGKHNMKSGLLVYTREEVEAAHPNPHRNHQTIYYNMPFVPDCLVENRVGLLIAKK